MTFACRVFAALAILCPILLTSCARDLSELTEYVPERAAGRIGGQDWRFVYGYTDPEAQLPEGIDYFVVLLTRKPKHACPSDDVRLSDPRSIVFMISHKTGEVFIGDSATAKKTAEYGFKTIEVERNSSLAFTLEPSGQKMAKLATQGRIRIDKINGKQIRGRLLAKHDDENFANGTFSVRICRYGELD